MMIRHSIGQMDSLHLLRQREMTKGTAEESAADDDNDDNACLLLLADKITPLGNKYKESVFFISSPLPKFPLLLLYFYEIHQ